MERHLVLLDVLHIDLPRADVIVKREECDAVFPRGGEIDHVVVVLRARLDPVQEPVLSAWEREGEFLKGGAL